MLRLGRRKLTVLCDTLQKRIRDEVKLRGGAPHRVVGHAAGEEGGSGRLPVGHGDRQQRRAAIPRDSQHLVLAQRIRAAWRESEVCAGSTRMFCPWLLLGSTGKTGMYTIYLPMCNIVHTLGTFVLAYAAHSVRQGRQVPELHSTYKSPTSYKTSRFTGCHTLSRPCQNCECSPAAHAASCTKTCAEGGATRAHTGRCSPGRRRWPWFP